MFFGRPQQRIAPDGSGTDEVRPLYVLGCYQLSPQGVCTTGIVEPWHPQPATSPFTYDGPCIVTSTIDLENEAASETTHYVPPHSVLLGVPADFSCGYDTRALLMGNFAEWVMQTCQLTSRMESAPADPVMSRVIPTVQRTALDWRRTFWQSVMVQADRRAFPPQFLHDLVMCRAFAPASWPDSTWAAAIKRAWALLDSLIEVLCRGRSSTEATTINRLMRYCFGVHIQEVCRDVDEAYQQALVARFNSVATGVPYVEVSMTAMLGDAFAGVGLHHTARVAFEQRLLESPALRQECGAVMRPLPDDPSRQQIGFEWSAEDSGTDRPTVQPLSELFHAFRSAVGESLDRSVPTDRPVRVVDLEEGGVVVERTPQPRVRSRPVELFHDAADHALIDPT
jgi:hypothetical protein